MGRFIIFVDYSNLASGYERAYGHRLDVAGFKVILSELVTNCRHRGFRPSESASYIYVYLPDEPGHKLGSEILELLSVFERGEIEGAILRGGLLNTTEEVCDSQWSSGYSEQWIECTAKCRRTEEKQTEVSLATDLVRFACRNYYEMAVLVSADRDFIPCVKAVKRGEGKRVLNVFPRPPSSPKQPRSKHQLAAVCGEFCDLQELRAEPSTDRALEVPSDRIRLYGQYSRPDGENLAKDQFRKWVRQFGSERRQRLAEILLTNVDFYGRKRMQAIIRSLLKKVLNAKRADRVAVAPLGKFADSSALVTYVAREVLSDFGLDIDELPKLARASKAETIVFLDDNIGSGMQASEIFSQWFEAKSSEVNEPLVSPLSPDTREWLRDRALIVLTCVSYQEGKEQLREALGELGLNLETFEGFTSLDETSGCFHPARQIYSEEDRKEARKLMEEIGYALLERKGWSEEHRRENALGYGGRQGLSVFFYNTPTSTLPVLWSEGLVGRIPWYPVFQRRERA